MNDKKTEIVSFRICQNLLNKLRAVAIKEERSLSYIIEKKLKKSFEN